MALWKDTNTGFANPSTPSPAATSAQAHLRDSNVAQLAPASDASRRPAVKEQRLEMRESVIAGDLTIEGKIVGAGHVRIAGRFKGDVQVEGNVTLDQGSHLEGQIRAAVVIVGGELIGNIENAKRVELLETGTINGDVKAGSLAVAAGSRMRGQVEFGYDESRTSLEVKGFGSA
jgi:cytoskeletal protein CcmA (bactofilin family)